MKNIISVLLCVALLLTVLSGCNRQAEPTEPTQAPTQPLLEVELELPQDLRPYLGVQLQFLSHLTAEDPRAEVLRQAAEVFELRTGAQVQFTWGQEEGSLAARVTSGEPVDIYAAPVELVMGELREQALDLTAMAEAAQYGDHSHRALRNQIIGQCGYLAAIPQEPTVYGVYYNADVFAAAGVTEYPSSWAEFLSMSEMLVQQGYMPLSMDIQNSHLILELHLERFMGIDRFKQVLSSGGWTKEEQNIDLFRLPIEYAAAGYLAKGDPVEFPGGQDKLALSNVAMVVGSNALCGQVEESTQTELNWGVFAYPGDGPGTGFAAQSRVLAVHSGSDNAQAAFDFIMLVTTGDFDRLYAEAWDGIPADPANPCAIAGARELLDQPDARIMGILLPKSQELFSQLWNGWYQTPRYFAIAMNRLTGDYKNLSGQGVG